MVSGLGRAREREQQAGEGRRGNVCVCGGGGGGVLGKKAGVGLFLGFLGCEPLGRQRA